MSAHACARASQVLSLMSKQISKRLRPWSPTLIAELMACPLFTRITHSLIPYSGSCS